MFNGIIYNSSTVEKVLRAKNSIEIILKTKLLFQKNEIGSSICCNGVCLTLTKIKGNLTSFYLSKETLKKTNFRFIKKGHIINIEKSLSHGSKISGHYVQGHVDTTAKIQKITIKDKTWIINFVVGKNFSKYLIEKGSIAINGVSLTISKKTKNQFEINIIPHTLKLTNLQRLKEKDLVNIEFDIFSKYLINLNK
ncbi:MAG: riboflavin synthase [Pelagibacteraceae bacterium]|jgi:riboflavin synthase|nr:riboflavin synthase [Pelagibacteraceae bacterium]